MARPVRHLRVRRGPDHDAPRRLGFLVWVVLHRAGEPPEGVTHQEDFEDWYCDDAFDFDLVGFTEADTRPNRRRTIRTSYHLRRARSDDVDPAREVQSPGTGVALGVRRRRRHRHRTWGRPVGRAPRLLTDYLMREAGPVSTAQTSSSA